MGLSGRKASGGLGDLVHIIIVVVLVGLVFVFGSKLFGAILGGGNKDSLSNFNALADNIEIMVEKPTSFEYDYMSLFFERGYYVFSFSTVNSNIPFDWRPDKGEGEGTCRTKPCLCIYKKFSDFPSKPLRCRTFNDNVIFHSHSVIGVLPPPYYERNAITWDAINKPQDPGIYSDYPDALTFPFREIILSIIHYDGVDYQPYIYLEKFVAPNGVNHILLTRGLSDKALADRINSLALCPTTYDPDNECDGIRRNSNIGGSRYCYFDNVNQICIVKENVNDCPFNQKLSGDCICGLDFYDKLSQPIGYCYQRSDGKIFLLEFDCTSDEYKSKGCPAYCITMTKDTDTCDSDEQQLCIDDVCGFGEPNGNNACEVYASGSSVFCRHWKLVIDKVVI